LNKTNVSQFTSIVNRKIYKNVSHFVPVLLGIILALKGTKEILLYSLVYFGREEGIGGAGELPLGGLHD
jgi:hypothetical protein